MSRIVGASLFVHSTTNAIISFVGCLINPDFSHSPPHPFPLLTSTPQAIDNEVHYDVLSLVSIPLSTLFFSLN